MDIVDIFLKHPEKSFHIRELSRMFGKSPTTISNKLKKLEGEGLLYSENKYGHLIFSLKENVMTRRLIRNYNINIIERSGLIEYLEDYYGIIDAMILFGSFHKGENNEYSDIDLLIISPISKEPDLKRFEERIGHKIQLFVHSKKDLSKIRDKNKELFTNWINGNVIYGYFEALI